MEQTADGSRGRCRGRGPRTGRGSARGGGGARGGRGARGGSAARGGGTRSRGRGCARVLDFNPVLLEVDNPVEVPSAVAGPSRPRASIVDELKKIKKQKAVDKKNMARLTAEQRARLKELRDKKEVAQFLMPDAPSAKKSRKVSPERVPCPLLPETPEVPPPRILQHWELKKTGDRTSELVFTPSTGVRTVRPDEVDDLGPLMDVNIEFVGFSSSTSSTVPQDICPMPSTSTRPEPSIFDTVTFEPGSDVEEEDCLVDGGASRPRNAADFEVENLSSELRENLDIMDKQDDNALRELANDDMLAFDWSHDRDIFVGERETFTGIAGTTFSAEGMSPFQFFSKIWDEDIINMIVKETNRYGDNLCGTENLKTHSRFHRWTPITAQELWTYFAILMLQSIAPLPVEHEYWRPCLPYLKLGNFADIMAFNRFSLIKRCLHFVDNTIAPSGNPNRLTKMQPILDHLNKKFSSLYLPEQEIAIDESLLLWKGRLSFAQLISNKAAQVGIKSYELCESRTGYLWQMLIYTGKSHSIIEHDVRDDSQPEGEGATSKIVHRLVRPLLNKGHTLVMDNFYNSPLLSRTLKSKKTDVMGTLRLNREFVPESLRGKNKANMRQGEVAYSQTKDVTITVWKDANVVSMISTYHKIEVGGKEKHGYYKYKPKVVLDYNLSMGGIDKKDQLLQAFPIERVRNHIWYKKLFRRLFNVSIHNAFVMYNSAVMPNINQRPFRVQLVDEILKRFRPPKIHAPPGIGHYPARNASKRFRCKWCAQKKIDTCTIWKCDACNVNLCILGCFKDYHTSI